MTMSPADRDRDQGLLDPGKEACAVDRAIENAGRGDPVVTQGGNERGCLPVAMGNGRHHPFAARCPAITPGHVRPRPGLVEKDQPFGNQPRLLVAPSGLAQRRDVRALLLGGVGCAFFATQPLSQKKVAKRRALLASIPSAASKTQSSSMVMSQFSITRARMRSPWGASFDFFQPPYLSALIVPRCFQRCISFTTKLMLTSN